MAPGSLIPPASARDGDGSEIAGEPGVHLTDPVLQQGEVPVVAVVHQHRKPVRIAGVLDGQHPPVRGLDRTLDRLPPRLGAHDATLTHGRVAGDNPRAGSGDQKNVWTASVTV